MWLLVFQRLVLEFILDFAYFPLWWYSGGLKQAFLGCWHLWRSGNLYLAPGLWLKNIFVPMYGQTDWQGRLVSVFMRLVNVLGRGFTLFVWLGVVIILFLFWLAAPVLLVWLLWRSLFVR